VWQNWSLATVRVNGLNVRTGPSLSDPLVSDESGVFAANGVVRLDAGDHVLVMGLVEPGDGSQWVQIGAQQVGPQYPVVGWAVAGTLDDPWVDGSESGCPDAEPSLDGLLQLSGLERMGCYSAAPLTFAAHQATIPPNAGLGGLCLVQAVPWLRCDNINYNWVNRDGGYDWEFLLHFDPSTGIAATGLAKEGESRPLDITGHFMDAQATQCAPNPLMTNEDMARYLSCSTLFVIETIE
jgi:hypothetical protein